MAAAAKATNAREAPLDGRVARSERTRAAIAEAMLALFREGELRPTAPQVAERAGVSLRSVFQHFEDMEALNAAVAERQFETLLNAMNLTPRDGPLDRRIEVFVAERAKLHESITPVRRAALLVEPFSKVIASRLRWARRRGRTEVAKVFRIELESRLAAERRELLEALTMAGSWSAWEALRAHQGLSAAHAQRVMARTVRALLQ
ncbi:MAG TPA: TetR/AcrR family transcriptional regulator [Dehalococcoidia bacterium]|nr:TetR/AcrR family transcriptional regulator [Dehalococcoidia bacterium]